MKSDGGGGGGDSDGHGDIRQRSQRLGSNSEICSECISYIARLLAKARDFFINDILLSIVADYIKDFIKDIIRSGYEAVSRARGCCKLCYIIIILFIVILFLLYIII